MGQKHTDPDPEHRFKALEWEPAAQGEGVVEGGFESSLSHSFPLPKIWLRNLRKKEYLFIFHSAHINRIIYYIFTSTYLVMVCYPLNGDPELLSGKPAAECPLGGQGCAPAQFPIMAAHKVNKENII